MPTAVVIGTSLLQIAFVTAVTTYLHAVNNYTVDIVLALSLIVGITGLVAIVLNYIKKDEVAGTLFESHFRWQIRTFWYGLLWAVIGGITFVLVIGMFILLADLVWFIYRIAKGWLNLNENKPMYAGK